MSIEDHPNFHAVKFVTGILKAYYASLRGEANAKNAPDITALVEDLSVTVEERINKEVRS